MKVSSCRLLCIITALLLIMSGHVAAAATFSRQLSVGMSGADILALQQLLNSDSSTAVKGLPKGQENGYFGPATKDALIRFQEKNASLILTPNGLKKGTGIAGPSTLVLLNRLTSVPAQAAPLSIPPSVPTAHIDPVAQSFGMSITGAQNSIQSNIQNGSIQIPAAAISGSPTLSGLNLTGAISSTGTATSTFANGIALSGGCVSVGGTCISGSGSGSGTVSSGIAGQIAWYASSGTTVSGTSTITTDSVAATSTTATSTFSGGLVAGNNASFIVNKAAPSNTLVIDSAGNASLSGSNRGAQLVSSWNNNGGFVYETFSTSGANITSAINSSGYGIGYTTIPIVAGTKYRLTFTLTLNSGTAPTFASCTDQNVSACQISITTSAGSNTIDWTSTRSGTEYIILWVDTGVATNYSVSNLSLTTLSGGDITVSGLTNATGGISSPQNTTSERFGAGASVLGTAVRSVIFGGYASTTVDDSIAIGYGVNTSSSGFSGTSYGGSPVIIGSQARGSGVALGYKAQATNYEAVALGPQTRASGLATIALGDATRALPSGPNGNEVVIGDVAWATGNVDYIIGGGMGTARDYVSCFSCLGQSIGFDKEVATADHQGFLGWYQEDGSSFTGGAGSFNDWWLGGPVQASAAHPISLNITSGSGTNVPGVNFTIVGSRATGNAAGGDILFSTSNVTGSGGTLQSTSTKLTIKASGGIGIGVSSPLAELQVATSTSNATTTLEVGKTGQNKGSCLVMYDATGTVKYVSIQGGALTVSATTCK